MPARQADLLGQLPVRRDLAGSPGDVALAGRDLEQIAIERRPVLAHEHDRSSSSTGTTDTAPGWCTMSRVDLVAVGRDELSRSRP